MRILVTGHRGHVGAPVARQLAESGFEVAGFDRADGQDVLDPGQLKAAAAACAAVVHLAALAHDTAGRPEQVMAANVLGTWHTLLAAEAAGMSRVIHFSSAQVFGIAEGERLPDYFPVDDAHPRRAMRAYGLSKCLAEDLCAGFTARTGIPSVSLRPVWVWDPGQYGRIKAQWRGDPGSEWTPFWEYGAFVGRAGRSFGRLAGADGATGRPSPAAALRCRHRGQPAQPRPGDPARGGRTGAGLGPVSRRAVAGSLRLLSRCHHPRLAAQLQLVWPWPARSNSLSLNGWRGQGSFPVSSAAHRASRCM